MKPDAKLATIRHRTTMRSHYQTTVAPNNDIQISLLPDLSGTSSLFALLLGKMFQKSNRKYDLYRKFIERETAVGRNNEN